MRLGHFATSMNSRNVIRVRIFIARSTINGCLCYAKWTLWCGISGCAQLLTIFHRFGWTLIAFDGNARRVSNRKSTYNSKWLRYFVLEKGVYYSMIPTEIIFRPRDIKCDYENELVSLLSLLNAALALYCFVYCLLLFCPATNEKSHRLHFFDRISTFLSSLRWQDCAGFAKVSHTCHRISNRWCLPSKFIQTPSIWNA